MGNIGRLVALVDGDPQGCCTTVRLADKGRTSFWIASVFSNEYRLSMTPKNYPRQLSTFNRGVKGFDEEGMLFSKETGRHVPFQSEVYVGVPYVWVGKKKNLPEDVRGVVKKCIAKLPEGWVAYEVTAIAHTDDTIIAFIKLGARLCEVGDAAYPLWPAFVQKDELTCIDSSEMFFWGTSADATYGAVPDEVVGGGKISRVSCAGISMPISFMNPGPVASKDVARDVEIWKDDFCGQALEPFVEIWDPDRKQEDVYVDFGVYDILPKHRRLNFQARSEGRIEIRSASGRQDRRYLKAQALVPVEVERGMSIAVFQGLDLIGEIVFKEIPPPSPAIVDNEKLSKVERQWLSLAESIGGEGRMLSSLAGRVRDCPGLFKRLHTPVDKRGVDCKTMAVVRKILNRKSRMGL